MDLSMLEMLIPNVADWLNVDPATVLLYLTLFCTIANLLGRLIPDDAEGFLGKFRDLCKVIGVYTPNRVSRGVSVNDVARAVVSKPSQEVLDMANDPDSLIPEVIEDVAEQIVPAFPGLLRDEKGRFIPKEKGNADTDDYSGSG